LNKEIDEIILGCQNGKYKSQKKLYERFSSVLYAICIRYLKDSDDANDCLQDAFIKIYDRIKDFKRVENENEIVKTFVAWIKKIQINECLMFLRNKKKLVIKTNIEDLKFDIADEQVQEDLRAISTEKLFALIKELPDGYRTVLNMYILDGFSHQEIADSLSISVGTSKSQLARAKKIIQDKILLVINENR